MHKDYSRNAQVVAYLKSAAWCRKQGWPEEARRFLQHAKDMRAIVGKLPG